MNIENTYLAIFVYPTRRQAMNKEIIYHKDKKITKTTKSNGTFSYTQRGVYLGVDLKTGNKVTTSITGRTLKELDRNLLQARLDFKKNGSTKKEQLSISSFSDLAKLWFTNYRSMVSSENTLNRVASYIDNYIIPQFGDYKPEMIEPSDIQIWLNTLVKNAHEAVDLERSAKNGKTQEFGAIMHKLSDIFDYGITNFNLKTNPASVVKIPPKPKRNKKQVKVLHDDDLSIWLTFLKTLPNNRANKRFILICDTLLASALRINELLALTLDDLNLETSEIRVDKTLMWKKADKKNGLKGKVICKPTPKTQSGYRSVSIPRELILRLIEWHKENNAYFKQNDIPDSPLIFPTVHGNYMCDRNERATLKKRLSEAGLFKNGFHLFRHTHASILLNAGANWKEIQTRLGHKSISTTMDLYAELAPKKRAEISSLFSKKLTELSD